MSMVSPKTLDIEQGPWYRFGDGRFLIVDTFSIPFLLFRLANCSIDDDEDCAMGKVR